MKSSDRSPVVSTETTGLPLPLPAEDPSVTMRTSLIQAGLLLVLLFAGVGTAGLVYEEELTSFTNGVLDSIGLLGLCTILFLSDSVTTPIPPDLVLLVVAKSSLSESWWWVVPLLGFVSISAGLCGYWLGVQLGRTRIPRLVFGRHLERTRGLVQRYGAWGVALGALTPIPFSLSCWTAGMFRMPFAKFAMVATLRLPRCLGYYWVIVNSDRFLRFLF